MLPGDIYTPVANDGETNFRAQIEGDGVPGFIGNSDGTVSQVLIRVSPDHETAYVSMNGGPERAFTERSSYYSYQTYFYGDYSDGTQTVYVNADSNNYGDYPTNTAINGEDGYGNGYAGLETSVDALPTEAAVYSGNFSMSGETGYIYASMGMELDFASGDIDGIFGGSYGAQGLGDEEEYEYGTVLGQIDGSISGSRIAGTAFATSGAEGTFDFMGGVYGDTGNSLAGGIAGTLTTEGGDHTMGGGFYLNTSGYFGFN
jgi:hypothetical protein